MPSRGCTLATATAIAVAVLSLTACAPETSSTAGRPTQSATQQPSTEVPQPPARAGGGDLREAPLALTWQDAVAVAQTQFDGLPTNVDLVYKHGEWTYTIDLVDSTREFEIEINAMLGTSGDGRIETLDADDVHESMDDAFAVDGLASADEVVHTASDAVPGVPRAWTLDKTDAGWTLFEVKVLDERGAEHEVLVDAMTGDFVGFDD